MLPQPASPTHRPALLPRLNRNHPLARGLVFYAHPVGNTFIDLVTGVLGTRTGALTTAAYGPGASARAGGLGVAGTGASTDQVIWPASLSRGGSITTAGTILALAGSTEQVDGKAYIIGGNTEGVTIGDGFTLGIDSYSLIARGAIASGRYNTLGAGYSNTSALGNPFGKQTHFFGYSFFGGGGGSNGTYFARREAWPGGMVAPGTTTTNRRAVIHSASDGATSNAKNAFVLSMMIWDRALSLAEYQALYDNPHQLLAAPSRRVWVPAPASGGGTTYFKSIAGVLTPYGTATKKTKAPKFTGSIAPAGTLSDQLKFGRVSAGSLTVHSSLRRKTSRRLTGALTAAGALRRKTRHALGGSLTATGALLRKTRHKLLGALTATGASLKGLKFLRSASGSITGAGTAAGTKTLYVPSLISRAAAGLYSMLSRR